MSRNLVIPTCALLLIGLVGCSGERVVRVDLPVDKSQPVNSLDEAGQKLVCEEVARAINELMTPEWTCLAAAAQVIGGDVEKCESFYKVCLEQPPKSDAPTAQEMCAEITLNAFEKCDVKVSQLEQCFNDMLAIVQQWVDGISCSAKPSTFPFESEANVPASCMALAEKCPLLFDDDEVVLPEPRDDPQ